LEASSCTVTEADEAALLAASWFRLRYWERPSVAGMQFRVSNTALDTTGYSRSSSAKATPTVRCRVTKGGSGTGTRDVILAGSSAMTTATIRNSTSAISAACGVKG
jgi:hypothetical protein